MTDSQAPQPAPAKPLELKDLVGSHMLDAVDMRQAAVTDWGGNEVMANAIAFRLDGIAYVAMEDDNDGYRSAMREITVTTDPMKNVFAPLAVVGRHRTKGTYSGTDDVLELIDAKTGEVVLEVGTDNVDDYYPGFVSSFHPERMAHNIQAPEGDDDACTRSDTFTHKTKGGEYTRLGWLKVQTDAPLNDLDVLVVYQGADGKLWGRPPSEFNERFTGIKPTREPIGWQHGPNLFKDWCAQWFGPDSDDAYLARAVAAFPVGQPTVGELPTQIAIDKAKAAMGYSQAFDGKGIDWQNGEPWPHRIELAQALDWITDLGAVVLNLADRVVPPLVLAEPAAQCAAEGDVTDDMRSAVRWAPSSAYWSERLREFFGPDAREGIDVLERRLSVALAAQANVQPKGAAAMWLGLDSRPEGARGAYLVRSKSGQVAPWINGVIHNAPGTECDWSYGQEVAAWMPFSALGQAPAPVDALREMEARKNAAYEERNRCVALIARMAGAMGRDVRVTRTAIEGWSDDWHGCIYIDLPTGQASWHFHDSQAGLFAGLPTGDATWDGHDTPEKYRRVANAFSAQGGSCASRRGEDPRGCWNVRCQLGAKCVQAPAVTHQAAPAAEPVSITAVGEIKRDAEGQPDVSWYLEGGPYELPDGVVLLVADKAITDDCGHGEVHTRPLVSLTFAQIDAISHDGMSLTEFTRAIERAHGIGSDVPVQPTGEQA